MTAFILCTHLLVAHLTTPGYEYEAEFETRLLKKHKDILTEQEKRETTHAKKLKQNTKTVPTEENSSAKQHARKKQKEEKVAEQNKTSLDKQKTEIADKKKLLKHEQKTSTRPLLVQSNITKQMISYNHWSGTYTPEFILKAEGIEIPLQSSTEINVKDKKCKLSYEAKFPAQYHSQDEMIVSIDNETEKLEITFDWAQSPRMLTSQSKR